MAFTAFFMNVLKIIVYSQYKLLSIKELPILIGLFCASFFGVILGKRILSKVNKKMFEEIVFTMLVLASIKMLFF